MPSAASTCSSVTATRQRQRAGHLERGEHLATVAAGAVDEQVDRPRRRPWPPSAASPRSSSVRTASGDSGSRRNSVLRLRSGGLTSKNGFSVVAPISVSVPSSTAGSSASCCDLEKRWISSRNRIVPRSCSPRRWRARSITSRTSFTPAVTADSCSNARRVVPATASASVVLPVPGGPQKIALTSAGPARPGGAAAGPDRRGGPGRRRRRSCVAAAGRRAAPGCAGAPRRRRRTGRSQRARAPGRRRGGASSGTWSIMLAAADAHRQAPELAPVGHAARCRPIEGVEQEPPLHLSAALADRGPAAP